MQFIRVMSLYYCRHIVSFVTYVETFVVTDVPEYGTAVPSVTYVAYVLCAIITSTCMSTFGIGTFLVSKIRVRTMVGSNNGIQVTQERNTLVMKNTVRQNQ